MIMPLWSENFHKMAKPFGYVAKHFSRTKLSYFLLKDYALRRDVAGLAKEIVVSLKWNLFRQLALYIEELSKLVFASRCKV